MGRKNGSFLLDDGDELRLCDSVTLIFRSHIQQHVAKLKPVQQREAHVGYNHPNSIGTFVNWHSSSPQDTLSRTEFLVQAGMGGSWSLFARKLNGKQLARLLISFT